jgi:hypothetical protein
MGPPERALEVVARLLDLAPAGPRLAAAQEDLRDLRADLAGFGVFLRQMEQIAQGLVELAVAQRLSHPLEHPRHLSVAFAHLFLHLKGKTIRARECLHSRLQFIPWGP